MNVVHAAVLFVMHIDTTPLLGLASVAEMLNDTAVSRVHG